ncbi:glycosyltransferase [Candidatus Babela massiliensis]|uniref:Glycosyltransferase n=1 Tax=Candidatus Babela massiliensis TaxID=673862 RepID=V6DIJ9_9BACT|nr:glycosyltransferase [Candidatus Babela massiliensis]CDK30753.1 Glycosyltransferase [Candidatus Babela massiliensis]
MKIKFFTIIIILSIVINAYENEPDSRKLSSPFDVTVIGYILYPDGLGRLPIGFIENFQNKLKINFIDTKNFSLNMSFGKITDKVIKIVNDKDKRPGKVGLLFDGLWNNIIPKLPNTTIKIAYSMFESTQIPQEWVNNLNNYFDSVVVPAPFLVEVYKNSGVNIPIFYLPIGMYLEEFLNSPIKIKQNIPFVFGTSAAYHPFKNQELLLNSFISKFANNANFKLRIHAKGETENSNLRKIIKTNNIHNVEIISKFLSPSEYIDFLKSLDCYVLVSRGEGFSLTPREALAMGIPCILSNNTAHKVLCQTSYVKAVNSNIKQLADYSFIFGKIYGYNFDTDQKDLEDALMDVYLNYNKYLRAAHQGREWVKQYLYKNLANKYVNLIKPKKIILGNKNIITDNGLMTNSKKLYDKYVLILEQ